MLGVPHPINDPSLVSYHRPELLRQLSSLEVASDCWYLLDATYTDKKGSYKAVKEKYLHREEAEPVKAYQERLHRATYAPIYRDSIRAYAGLLNRFQLVDAPASMAESEKNIDLQGESIQSFWNRCDERALRDGGVYIMVDMTQGEEDLNFLDEQESGRRPYLIMIDRQDVINWSVVYEKGRERIGHATIRQMRQVPIPNGFGVELEAVYHVLKPNLVESYRLEKNGNKWTQIKINEVKTSLPVVPLVWYGATSPHFAQGELPLNGLAELSIQHFQMRSDLHELLHKCAMPVPVRTGARIGPDGRPVPLVLGPNTAVDLDAEGGKFEFAEPSGRSLERHQAEIRHVEELMDRSGLNFLYGANIKTATEASLRASQIASQVAALVRNKTAAFNIVMRLWAAYNGELANITSESGIAMNDSLINKPLGASEIAQLVNLYSQGILSKRTILDELQRGGILDPDLKVEEEISRTEEDRKEELDQSIKETIQKQEAFQPSVPEQSANPTNKTQDGREPIVNTQSPERLQAAAQRAQ
ncbi:MAG: DUF4055 domain-containing protein [Candidatus Nanopelagicaceae bacterium]